MKILYVIGAPDIGGTEKQLLGLVKEMQVSNQVAVAFLRGSGDLRESFDCTSADIIDLSLGARISSQKPIKAFFRLRQLLKVENFDVVHLFLPESVIIGYLSFVGIRKKSKLVAGVRGSNWRRGRSVFYIYKHILRKMSLVICNSKELAKICVDEYRVKPEKVYLISNGVEIHSIPMRNYEKIRAVYVANFHAYKGHMTLIEAIKDLDIDIELKLVGDGSAKENARLLVERLGLEEKISFLGTVHPEESYKWANLMIHASQTEGLSNAILEGLSWGLPIIGFNIGGNSELISHGCNGFLIDKYGAEQLAETLKEVELKKLRNMGEESYKIGLLHSWERLSYRHNYIYGELTKL